MKYFIFRHGETYQSKHEIPYGINVESAQILPEGEKVIEKLALHLKKIKSDLNMSSPYLRCRETVEIVTKITGKKFIFKEDLGEYREEKETIDEFISRLKKVLQDIEESKANSVLICTHGYPISALIQLITRGFVNKNELENYPRPGKLVYIENKKAEFINFN